MDDTKTPLPENYALILSVGGSPDPLILSLYHHRPARVVFIASEGSNAKVEEILEKTPDLRFRYETITLSDHENLVSCCREIREALPEKIRTLNLAGSPCLIADITGGTKVMSASLALAMMEFNSLFNYVGGTSRNKDGLGTVESGHEKMVQVANPWDVMGLRDAQNLVSAFNMGQYEAAKKNADFLVSRDIEYKAFYEALGNAIESFRKWDIFDYKSANPMLNQAIGRLASYNNRRHSTFQPLFKALEQARGKLNQLAEEASILRGAFQPLEGECGAAYLADLVANARRSAEKGRYDDAVARLYSAVEKTAKIALQKRGINNSKVNRDTIEKAGGELAQKFTAISGDEFKLGLQDSFRLLTALEPDNTAAKAFNLHKDELDKALEKRNMSLLAHGHNPVSESDYNKFFKMTLDFLGLTEADLYDFPKMKLDSVLF